MIGARRRRPEDEGGFVLILSLIVMVAGLALGSAGLFWATQEVKVAQNVNDKKRSFYLADAGAEYALTFMNNQLRATTFETWFTDNTNTTNAVVEGVTIYTTRAGFPPPYTLNGVAMQPVIEGPADGPYTVTVEADDRGSISKVTAIFRQFPNTARVFDNAYFINNWGWFYGAGITANGDVRSNGDFDARSGPTINGQVFAAGLIKTDGSGINGKSSFVQYQYDEAGHVVRQPKYAGEPEPYTGDPVILGAAPKRGPNQPKLPMPNLKDLGYYEAKAREHVVDNPLVPSLRCWDAAANAGAGAYFDVFGVQGDDAGEKQGLYCAGDAAHPVLLSGPVVVRGDLVIKGKIDGTGSIYSGGNTYVAGNLEYVQHTGANRPMYNGQLVNYNDTPDTLLNGGKPLDVVDGYVEQRIFNGDPLASLSARKNVIIGDYTGTTGGSWPSGTYLYTMGKEDGVGLDGIAGTTDDTTPNGRMDPGEDIDEDGVLRTTNYTYAADVVTNLTTIDNLPAGTTAFSQIATNAIGKLEGVFYTNHAVAGRLNGDGDTTRTGSNAIVNGAMISKDEAIYFTNTLDFNYDERVNSRYVGLDSGVDLDLPKILTIGVQEWKAE
jgi:hypothetical protein